MENSKYLLEVSFKLRKYYRLLPKEAKETEEAKKLLKEINDLDKQIGNT